MVRTGTAVLLALALGAPVPAADVRQDGERYVYVTVIGRDGAPITGLTPEHFAVRESGRDRPVTSIEPLTIPMHVAVLVDTSGHGGVPDEGFRSAVADFAVQLAASHHVALYAFGDRPALVAGFTQDPTRLRAGVAGLFTVPHERSPLVDAVDRALKDLGAVEAKRPVIVAITSESPEASSRTAGGVIRKLVDQSVALHVVAVATATRGSAAARVNRDIPSSSRTLGSMAAAGEGDRERTQMIEQGTAVTGGGRQRLASTLALGPALARVRQELSQGYLVRFSRSGGGRVKDLQVGVFADDVTVRATAAPFGTR